MKIDAATLSAPYQRKSTEELLVLHAEGTLTDTAYDAIEAELRARDVEVPGRPPARVDEAGRPSTLRAHWKGEANLMSDDAPAEGEELAMNV